MKEEKKNGTFFKISENCDKIAIVRERDGENFVLVCGEYLVSQKKFDTIDDAEEFIKNVNYDELFALIYVLFKYYSNEQTRKEAAN